MELLFMMEGLITMGAFGSNRTQAQIDDIIAATQVPYDSGAHVPLADPNYSPSAEESAHQRKYRCGAMGASGAAGGNYGGGCNEG